MVLQEFMKLEEEKRTFLQILHHDKKGGQMIRLRIVSEKESEQRSFCDIEELAATGTDMASYYVTVNTFRGYKREAARIFNYGSIFIDIDCHKSDELDIIEAAKERAMSILQEAYASGELAIPTMITDTGRGFGLQYVLNRSIANTWRTEKMIKLFKTVRKSIYEKYKEILFGDPMIEVDAAVLDDSRVCRLPGTYNKKAGRFCRLISVSGNYYELSDLVKWCHLWDWKPEEEYKKAKEEKEKKKKEIAVRTIVPFAEYKMPFLSTRLEQLEKLQEMRGEDCTDSCREQLLFIAYSALKQLDLANAALRLQEMNKRFADPLPQAELDHIIQETDQSVGIDHRGFYKLSNAYVVDMLALTDEEIKTLGIGQGLKRAADRKAARNRKKEKREKIVELLTQADTLTYEEIAEAAGVSRRTVCTVAKNEGLMRYAKAAQRQDYPEKKAEIIAIDSVREGERQAAESANFATGSVCVPLASTSGTVLSTLSVRGPGGAGLHWYDWLYEVAAGSTVAAELLAMYRWSFDSAGFFHCDLNDYLDCKMPYYMRHPDKLVDIRDLVARKFFRAYGINECAYLFGVYDVTAVLPTVWELFVAAGQREEQKKQKLEQKWEEKKRQHLIVDAAKETPERRKARINRHLKNYTDKRFEIIESTDEYKRRLDPDVLQMIKIACMQVDRLKRDFLWIEKKRVLTPDIKKCFDSLTYKDLAVICERMAHQGTIQKSEKPFFYIIQAVWKYRHPDAAKSQKERLEMKKNAVQSKNRFNNFEPHEYNFNFGAFMEANAMRKIMGLPLLTQEEFVKISNHL